MIGHRGRRTHRTTGLLLATLGLLTMAMGSQAPEGRIQDVQSEPGAVGFVLSAEGLTAGESIDPDSVVVTIGGVSASSIATPLSESVAAPSRTVMIALDSSGSMAENNKLATAQEAATSYLAGLPADVRVGLIAFADEARVAVAPTKDRAVVEEAIGDLEARGSTALNDAVVLAVDELGPEGSRNIVLLSDGADEGSQASGREARAALADSGVVLDAVSLGRGVQEKSLGAFARAGGGNLVTATDAQGLTAAFESAARSVQNQLAVRAQVPEGTAAGTAELVVTARVGDRTITDSAAAVIVPGLTSEAVPAAYGPIAVPVTAGGSFVEPWFLLAVIAVMFATLVVSSSIAVGVLNPGNHQAGRVIGRLQEVSLTNSPSSRATTPKVSTVLGEGVAFRAAASLADRATQNRDTTALSDRLEKAKVPLRPGEWIVIHGLIALIAGVLAILVIGISPWLTVAIILLGLLLPWWYLGRRANRRLNQFYDSLPDAMQMLAASLKAGYSLNQALESLTNESTGAFGEEMNRAVLESRLGIPIEDALEGVAHRMESEDFRWVVMAIQVNRRMGGNLAETLSNVGGTLRERERLRRQAKSLSAEGILSAWVIGSLPFVFMAFILVITPEYMQPMLTQPIGWLLLAVAVLAYLVGIIWLRNLVRIEV